MTRGKEIYEEPEETDDPVLTQIEVLLSMGERRPVSVVVPTAPDWPKVSGTPRPNYEYSRSTRTPSNEGTREGGTEEGYLDREGLRDGSPED